jgi:hypothetical protein
MTSEWPGTVTATFPFKPAAIPQPDITVRIRFRGESADVEALYDSGADITHLSAKWKQVFKVDDALVAEMPVQTLGGLEAPGAVVFVNAELDGHEFTMPVLFHPDDTTDLFGRPGINELYLMELDAQKHETRVTWQGGPETSADKWKAELIGKPGTFLPGWDQAPNP